LAKVTKLTRAGAYPNQAKVGLKPRSVSLLSTLLLTSQWFKKKKATSN
jgi:hypothetical protein